MGNFTNKGLNYRPTWASIQNKPTTISGWLTDVYTKSEVDSIVDDAIDDLVNAAPGALDTLNELAAALGDDANFATTVTNSLAGKVSLSGSYSKPSWLTQVAASIVEQSANYRFVTDTEKTTWNAKQDALSGGTTNFLTKWTGAATVGNSALQDDGSKIYSGRKTVIGAADVHNSTLAVNLDGANSEFYVGTNSVSNTQRLFISQARRSNWGDMLLGLNLTGVSGSDNFVTRATSNGYSGINFEYGGNIRFYASTSATTNNGVVTPISRMFIDGSDGNITIFSSFKTATPSANGAGAWKLGKLIGSDGTGATSFLELDIDGVVYILTAKIK